MGTDRILGTLRMFQGYHSSEEFVCQYLRLLMDFLFFIFFILVIFRYRRGFYGDIVMVHVEYFWFSSWVLFATTCLSFSFSRYAS